MRVGKPVVSLALLLLAGALVAWAMGAFRGGRIAPGRAAAPAGLPALPRTATAERSPVALFEEALGTVRSRTRVEISAQVIARILEVLPRVGTVVAAKDPLVRLDDRELAARAAQARKALAAAEAARSRAAQAKALAEARLTQARARHERQQRLLADKVTSPEQAEAAQADHLAAQAGLADAEASITAADAVYEQVQQVVREAEVALGYAVLTAPFDGVVSDRNAEPGDLASPGRALLAILDPLVPRLEAAVREGLIGRVPKGTPLEVLLPTAGLSVKGRVTEVAPSADPRTRSFLVRVDFDPVPGVYPGMFGRLRVPVGERSAVLLPPQAVTRVGQLETVLVQADGRAERRLVTTGAAAPDGRVEILSGLVGGETVGLPEVSR